MMRTLVVKLLRDVRAALIVVCLLLGLFQVLWTRITTRITGELVPAFSQDISINKIKKEIFAGPGKLVETIMGGESIQIERAMDILSIGYVHPAMIVLFSLWAVGRASGAIAGELDRGTMELLLAQPIPRYRVIASHLALDAITIPLLCLSMWAGTWVGCWLFTPIQPSEPEPPASPIYTNDPRLQKLYHMIREHQGSDGKLDKQQLMQVLAQIQQENSERPFDEQELVRFAIRVLQQQLRESDGVDAAERQRLLEVHPVQFGPSLVNVAALLFAISGYTMWLSAAGRFRWRVTGIAVLVTLIQFLVNLLGQLWDEIQWLRPFTVFYYYQPQDIILNNRWTLQLGLVWNHGEPLLRVPGVLVLFLIGAVGYAMALRVFCRRDLPAPL